MSALWAASITLALSAAMLSVAGNFRAAIRLRLLRTGIFIGLPSLTATLVLIPMVFNATFADALSVAGLGVSLLFGFSARALDFISLRVRVGVVIPSRVPFHTELRRGLTEGMVQVRATIYDDYLLTSRAPENLATFLPSLRRTMATKPDYLVVACPSTEMLGSPEVLSRLKRFQRRGGQLIFVDNQPPNAVREKLRPYGLVRADVEKAADLISNWVAQISQAKDRSVLIVSGPQESDPAQRYKSAFAAHLSESKIEIVDTLGWSETAAYLAVKDRAAADPPQFVVCGNDTMAFGAVRAVREHRALSEGWKDCKVVGYNGIARALFAISEPENPFYGTVMIPPSAYGDEIATMVVDDARRWIRRSQLTHVCIPLGEGQLIDATNVDLAMEE